MRRFFIVILLLSVTLCSSAQRRRRTKTPPPPTAEELAEQRRQALFEQKLNMTAKVTFIDSLLLKRQELMDVLSIGSENGSIGECAPFFGLPEPDTLFCTLFRSQLGDKIIFAHPDAEGVPHLYGSELIGDRWSESLLLPGLEDTVSHNHPFMLSDGITLYFASKGEESLGGYDIFMTRWDDDNRRFLKPENIGMPFNSKGNDYLYVVDEYNQLGWFVTDRGLSPDSICLYTFIPEETRQIYNTATIGRDTLVALAEIHSIRDTWTDEKRVSEAKKRLEEVKNTIKKARQSGIYFIINDNIIYTDLSQFRTKEGLSLAQKCIELYEQRNSLVSKLEELRRSFKDSHAEARSSMRTDILQKEQQLTNLSNSIHNLEKELRSYEQR